MTQKFNTGKTFATGEQVTAQDLENIVELATPRTALTDDQTLSVNNGQIVVKDGSSTDGVSFQKMKHIAARSVICNTGSSTAAPSALSIPNNQVLKGSANGLEAGTIDNDNLTNNGISIDADSGTTHEIDLGETLTVEGGTGIDTTINDTNNTLTIAGSNATTSDKGIASFSSSDFSVASGAVSIKPLGVSNAQLAGSIANSKLANDSVTVTAGTALSGGGEVDLGSSVTLNVSGVSNAQIASNAAIATSKLASNTIGVSAGSGLSGGGTASLGSSVSLSLSGTLPSTTSATTQAAGNNSTRVATTQYVDRIRPNIVHATKNTAETIAFSSENENKDIADLEVTITPRLANSTFIISGYVSAGFYDSNRDYGGIIKYKVNSGSYATHNLPTGVEDRIAVHFKMLQPSDDASDISPFAYNIPFAGLSYSVGDTITFKVTVTNLNTSNTLYINRSEGDNDNNDNCRTISTILVQEL